MPGARIAVRGARGRGWRIAMVAVAVIAAGGCRVRPQEITPDEMARLSEDRLARVTAKQEPVAGAIDLYEAMARALRYNLDHQVELLQTVVRTAELKVAHYNLLPNVVANSGYAARDNDNASSSFNLVTKTPNFGASTSQERELRTGDVTFSWNVLDFGLSYVRARQAGDKVLIAAEMRRKVANRIIEDVRTAYWRAISAERMIAKIGRLERRIETALASTRRIARDGQTSPVTALSYERELLEIRRTIQDLQRDLSTAKLQLAALMNLSPGTRFSLVPPRRTNGTLALPGSIQDMAWAAMLNRPELREAEYNQRINLKEAEAAILEMLPGLQGYIGPNADSNDFLLNNHWLSWGAKVSWNLIKVVNYPARRATIEAQDEWLDRKALAVTMAVLTQVRVSRVRFHHVKRSYLTSSEFLAVQRRLLNQMQVQSNAERVSEQTLVREEMNTLVAEVQRDIAYANLQNAYANAYASIGLDGYVSEVDFEAPVAQLAQSLRQLWTERGEGRPLRVSMNQR